MPVSACNFVSPVQCGYDFNALYKLHCLLGLKKYITPLLAGLLEVDTSKIWTFDKFFTEVTNMLSRKRIHIYHVHRMQNLRVYLHHVSLCYD